MLQLNHVTIKDKGRLLLDDCIFQFREGQAYVIVGDPDDFVAFSEAVCGERKTDAGEIITWDGANRFNSCDDSLMPEHLTAKQYAEGLLTLYKGGEGHEPGVYLLEAGFDTSKKDKLIKDLSDSDRAALRFLAVRLVDAYVNMIGSPLPELALLEEWVENNKDDKVIIFGVSDRESADILKEKTGAEEVRIFFGKSHDL